ncbi:MAG: hypothetical protein AAFV88_16480, partial [Planctomycetota bacterium]
YAERLVELDEEKWEYQLQKCLSIGKQVQYYGNRGDFEKAYELAWQTLDIIDALDLEAINDANLWMHRGLAVRLIGTIHTATGKYEDAIDAYTKAIDDYQRALELKPESVLLQRYIGVAHGGISSMQSRIGQFEKSFISNQQAIETFETLVSQNPLNSLYKYDLSNQLSSLAIAQWNQQKYQLALESGLRATQLREQLAERFPQKTEYIARLGRIYQNVSLYYSSVENETDSGVYARKAVEIAERVVALQPESVRYLSDLSRMRSRLANFLVDQNQLEEAESLIEASWEAALDCYEKNPAVIEAGVAVAEAAVSLGEFLLDQQKHEDALRVFDQGLEKSLNALHKAEGNLPIIRQLWPLFLGRGECLLLEGRPKEALEAKQNATQYARGEFRETVSMLETEQLKHFVGEESRPLEDIIAEIPSELLSREGRIQLELAFLIAVIVGSEETVDDDAPANIRLADLTKDCVERLEKAKSLASLSVENLTWLRSHPFFERVSQQTAFADWTAQFEQETK